jgi:uncharacterized protein (TIGR02246 family)
VRSHFLVLAVVAVLLVPTVAAAQAEEGAIKRVIETAAKAINKDDLTMVLAQYADDAKIYSRVVGRQVSKAEYAKIMADVFKAGNLINADLRDIKVTLDDPSRAIALGNVYVTTKTNRTSGRAEWKLEKRDGSWLIVETNPKQ